MPTEHSNVMGGSTAARRIHCPGSLQLESAHPSVESEFAARGSMLHAAMELILTADPRSAEELQKVFDDLKGQNLGYEGHEITQELIDEKLRPAWEAWTHVVDGYDLDDWFIEQRVSLATVIDGAFGTADVIAKGTDGRLHILDWKFGDGVIVPAEDNIGLGFYAAATLYDEDPELKEMTRQITGVVLHIVQPRVGSHQALYSWETTEDWVEDLVDLAAEAMDKARGDNPPLKPGSWCQFCRARPTCPAQQQLATEALSSPPEHMSAIELGRAMQIADQLKGWIADIYKIAQAEMENGAAIPGYKLVNKMPRRVWADEKEAEKRMKSARLKVGQMFTKKLISPTQAEKLDKQLYSNKLSDIVVMHSSGVTIVPDSDKRQAVVSGADLLKLALPEQKQ